MTKLTQPKSITSLISTFVIGAALAGNSLSLHASDTRPIDSTSMFSLQIEGTQYEHDDARFDTGPGITLEIPLAQNWYLTGMNSRNDLEVNFNQTAEFVHWMLGVGYRWELNRGNHVFVEVKSETQKLSTADAQIEERGASIVLGGNYQLSEQWNLTPHVRFSDINIAEGTGRSDEVFFGAELGYQVNGSWSLGVNYESGDYSRSGFFAKFSF